MGTAVAPVSATCMQFQIHGILRLEETPRQEEVESNLKIVMLLKNLGFGKDVPNYLRI